MWVFTNKGFVSVVQDHIDPDMLKIRARSREHLQAIKDAHHVLKGKAIKESSDTDYRYRMFVSRLTWAQVMSHMVKDINYTNFKDEASTNYKVCGSGYVHCLHDVWKIMYDYQQSLLKTMRLRR